VPLTPRVSGAAPHDNWQRGKHSVVVLHVASPLPASAGKEATRDLQQQLEGALLDLIDEAIAEP
jgi:hypothetical protein